jgi:mannan polymerase II complex MNN11 subunit
MAIVDQRVINAYNKGAKDAEYKDGDLAVRFPECTTESKEACEIETKPFAQAWRRVFENS